MLRGMKEKLNCHTCNATIDTSMNKCEYCGNDFRNNGNSMEILNLKNKLDEMLINSEPKDIIKLIDSSEYKHHPIIKHRMIKAELMNYLFEAKYIDSQKLCDIINKVNDISSGTIEYKNDFITYASLLFSSLHISISREDHENILNFINMIKFDEDDILTHKLTEILLVTELGTQFMKEYSFFTDKSNYINDSDFIKKRNFLVNKFNYIKNHIIK